MRTLRFFALAAIGLTVACASLTPMGVVNIAQGSLAAVEEGAATYASLPACGSVGADATVCSNPSLVAQAKAYDNDAYAALVVARKDAEAGKTPSMVAFDTAYSVFKAYVATLPTKGS